MSVITAVLLSMPLVAVALGVALPWRVGAPLLLGLVAILGLAMHATTDEDVDVPILIATISPWLVGCAIRSRRRLTAALAQRAAELEQERELHATLAAQQERARIARELHDIVAHHLAVIAVQAGAGRLSADPVTPERRERFVDIRLSAERALDELAVLVGVLHAEPAPELALGPRLDAAVDGARAAGLQVHAEVPRCDHLTGTLADTAFRVVQEGLTNAVKHAPGADVDVAVELTDGRLRVTVHDAGPRGADALSETGSGLGLRGLRERVEALGGALEAGAVDGGWQLRADLPLRTPALVEA